MAKDPLEVMAEAPAKVLDETISAATQIIDTTVGKPLKKAKHYWHMLGPGLTTGAADDDPSGVATYSQTGARYGFQLLWLALLTFPLMALVQEMCARIGMVTGRGLAANIRAHYPRSILYLCTLLLFSANVFNIGADLGAMAQGVQLLLPGASFVWLVVVFTLVSLLMQIFVSYSVYARILKYLALILLAYVFSTLLIQGLDWSAVVRHTVVPSLTFSRDQIILVCAILGTTISPYLFFWQTSQEIEEEILDGKITISARRGLATDTELKHMRVDVWSGMFLSNLVMFFIIVATGATLHTSGLTQISTAAEAAEALRPLAGDATYLLFALGIIGTGLLAVPVLAGSAAYAVSESFGWRQGLFYKLKQASAFYGILIIAMLAGLGMNFIGLDPIKALIYSAIANGLVAPIVLILIVQLSSSHKVMGEHRNRWFTTWFGWFVVAMMVLAGLATIIVLV